MKARPLAVLAALCLLVASSPSSGAEAPSVELKLKVPGVLGVVMEPVPNAERPGEIHYRVETSEGVVLLSPEAFTRFVYDQHRDRPFWKAILNITTPVGIAWVALGLLGQLIFAGRMVVQWLTSEREGRSVVPVAFWWMSLSGASMLLVYFIWRKDLVGVLGQSTGWLIYARNLYLIHRRGPVEQKQAVPQAQESGSTS